MKEQIQDLLKKIPAVNKLLTANQGQELLKCYTQELIVAEIRKNTDHLRHKILNCTEDNLADFEEELKPAYLLSKVENELIKKLGPRLVSAINGTGVIIHTNLGRSILSASAKEALINVAENYSTLEINRDTGERGSRYDNVRHLLQQLTGAEDCMVVNNNAAAVLLALNTLAVGKEVIISRGELVEVGGSFRIPDVMGKSGARLIEVGATNRVYLRDFEQALTDETGLILKVHTSNYKIIGFTEEVSLEKLAEFSHRNGLPIVEDLGSGILVDLADYGFSYEPTVQDSVKVGVDLVTFSGDKLLGGPQAGIIVGKKEYINRLKKNPLTRALRIDKLTLAALEATLRTYLDFDQAIEQIPTLAMLTTSPEELKLKAESIKEVENELGNFLKLDLRKASSRVGGGAYPTEKLFSYVLEISSVFMEAEQIASKLRKNDPPVFTRINSGKVIVDPRTIRWKELSLLKDALVNLKEGVHGD